MAKIKPVIPANSPDFLRREGLGESPAAWEDGLRIETGPGNFEWWYFDAHFSDGSTAVVVFSTKPFTDRNRPLTPLVQMTVTRPDGSRLVEAPFYPPDQFHASRDGCAVQIGPNRVEGDLRRYTLHVETPNLAAELVFTGLVPAWRPGAGKNYYDEQGRQYFGWLPAIPFGSVEGNLVYDGKTHAVHGNGYHDHNWGNIGLERVMDHWYWGRLHVGEFSAIFVEMTSSRAFGYQKLPVFMLAHRDRILTGDGKPLSLNLSDFVTHSGGRSYPRQVDFRWQSGGEHAHIALRQPQIIEAASLLGFFPAWKRRLFRLFGNPYYFRFQAELALSVDLQGVKAQEQGQAIYELMLLK